MDHQYDLIKSHEAIILDTETTGMVEPQVIELAWMAVDHPQSMNCTQSFHSFYKPSKPVELGALSTHNIIEEDYENAPPTSELKLPGGIKYMIGHNIDYDWGALGEPQCLRICTLALSRHIFPDIDAHNQTAMMYHLHDDKKWVREAVKQAHSALHDVDNCSFVLAGLIDELERRGTIIRSWRQLWELSEKARIPTKIGFGKHKGMLIKDLPRDYVSWCLRQTDMDPYFIKALRGL